MSCRPCGGTNDAGWRAAVLGLQLGLDTGGTYTDAVLVDDDQQVIAHAKCLTSHANLIDGPVSYTHLTLPTKA